jgi:hypothetical protein
LRSNARNAFFTTDYVIVFAKIALRALLRKNCIVGIAAQKIALRALLRMKFALRALLRIAESCYSINVTSSVICINFKSEIT